MWRGGGIMMSCVRTKCQQSQCQPDLLLCCRHRRHCCVTLVFPAACSTAAAAAVLRVPLVLLRYVFRCC